LKKSDVALIVEYDIFEENGRLRARPISKMIMCKICGFVLIKKGGEGDLLPSLTQGASTGSHWGEVGECAVRHSPSGWVTTAPDRRIYPQPRSERTLTSEDKKLTTSYQPHPGEGKNEKL